MPLLALNRPLRGWFVIEKELFVRFAEETMPAPQPISPRPPGVAAADLLETWKEIAVYLNRDLRTVKRWEASRGLPVHRLPGGPKAAVYALKSEVDAWRRGSGLNIETAERAQTAGLRPGPGWIAGAAVLATVAGVVLWRLSATKPPPGPHVVSVTNYRGVEWFPAFSPDGKQIAFSWNGEQEGNYDIYVKLVNLGNPVRITTDPAMDLAPAWSPDGRYIAFFRWNLGAPKVGFFIVPALGGAERRVAEGSVSPDAIGIPFPALAWTPDGNWLIKGSRGLKGSPRGLELVSVETGQTRKLTNPPAQSPGDCCPTVSPDGRTIAFLRASAARTYSPVVLDIGRNGDALGEARPLESPPCVNPLWSGDGSEVLCVAGGGEDRTLWHIPVRQKAAPQPFPSIGILGQQLAISPRGDRLVYSNSSWEGDIWELRLAGRNSPNRLIASTADDFMPQFSRNGEKISFLSSRSGRLEVWVSDRDGGNPAVLVPTAAPNAASWSPDGRQVAYTCRIGGSTEDICLIGSAGGTPRQLTKDLARDMLPSWSHDGRWVYFASDRSGTFQTWKMPADGSAPAAQVTKNGGFGGIESADGRFLYYGRTIMSSPICRVPVEGGEEVPLGDDIRSLRLPRNFAVGRDGIFFASSDDPSRRFELRFYSFASRKTEVVTRVEGGLGNGMALSPDGRSLLYTVEHHSGDLVMVENFR